jgi:hypothetical protein
MFVLSVWNDIDWSIAARQEGFLAAAELPPEIVRRFECRVVVAFGTWDQEHRDAFVQWCQVPFFP